MPRLVAILLVTMLSVTLATACSSGGGASSRKFTAQITISELRGEAMPVVIPAPPLSLTRGTASSITVTGAELTYTAEVLVTHPGEQAMATTSVEITRDGEVVAKPRLMQVVGRNATLRIGEEPEAILIEAIVTPE